MPIIRMSYSRREFASDVYVQDLVLEGDDLKDSGGNVILSSDGSGAIDSIAAITNGIPIPDSSIHTCPSPALSLISGGSAQTDGSARSTVTETLYFVISQNVPVALYGKNLKLQSVTIYYTTTDNADYITATRIKAITEDGSVYDLKTDLTDQGNGSTGNTSYTESGMNSGVQATIMLEIDTVVGTTDVVIEEIQCTYGD